MGFKFVAGSKRGGNKSNPSGINRRAIGNEGREGAVKFGAGDFVRYSPARNIPIKTRRISWKPCDGINPAD